MADLSYTHKHISMERGYFGSEHGKSESDGETGVINRALDRAIVGRKVVINSADKMVAWCSDNLCGNDQSTFSRKFSCVGKNEVNRCRSETEVKTVSVELTHFTGG